MARAGQKAEGAGVRWLLPLGLGLILVVAAGVLAYSRLVGPGDLPPALGLAGSHVTARQAFASAAELAAQWQEDARLAAVAGRWSAVGTRSGGQVVWASQFFSPSTQRLALITVAEGAAHMVREGASPFVVPTFSPQEWRVDSDRALWTWWDHGGEDLVARHPDADLAMQLRVPDAGGEHPVWTVAGSVPGAETTFTVVMDGTDGALLEQ